MWLCETIDKVKVDSQTIKYSGVILKDILIKDRYAEIQNLCDALSSTYQRSSFLDGYVCCMITLTADDPAERIQAGWQGGPARGVAEQPGLWEDRPDGG